MPLRQKVIISQKGNDGYKKEEVELGKTYFSAFTITCKVGPVHSPA